MRSRILLSLLLLVLGSAPAFADSLDDWIDLEQTRINRTVDENKILAPDVQNQARRFRPESQTWFSLKAIWIPESELHAALDPAHFDPEVAKYFVREKNGQREYRLLIHPESENFYRDLLAKYPVDYSTFRATSTASSRTVRVNAGGPRGPRFFAKLSLDVELGGVRRTVPRTEVARSVGTSIYLESLAEKIGPSPFVHIPEPFGISPKGWERGGMILRMVPAAVQENKTKLVPLFSLYAPDRRGRTLLQDLAEQAGVPPAEFVKENILAPFYDGWVRWNLEGAVTMEAHAQNVLLEMDARGRPTGRFVHRDLGGFNIDMQSKQFTPPENLPSFTNIANDYHQPFVGKAREQSLCTYFDGGFLFNVDKELERIQPGYKARSVMTEGRRILSERLEFYSGVKVPTKNLRSGPAVLQALRDAQAGFDKRAKRKRAKAKKRPAGGCPESFEAI